MYSLISAVDVDKSMVVLPFAGISSLHAILISGKSAALIKILTDSRKFKFPLDGLSTLRLSWVSFISSIKSVRVSFIAKVASAFEVTLGENTLNGKLIPELAGIMT